MIVVKIEMYPGGDKKGKCGLGVLVISNDGTGTTKAGNYLYTLSHAGKYFKTKKGVCKHGRVTNFPRAYSPYRLVQRVLKDAGEI